MARGWRFDERGRAGNHFFERIFRRFRGSLPVVDESAFADQLPTTQAAYLRLFDEDLQAALFLQETLRCLWPQLPATVRRQSLWCLPHAQIFPSRLRSLRAWSRAIGTSHRAYREPAHACWFVQNI